MSPSRAGYPAGALNITPVPPSTDAPSSSSPARGRVIKRADAAGGYQSMVPGASPLAPTKTFTMESIRENFKSTMGDAAGDVGAAALRRTERQ